MKLWLDDVRPKPKSYDFHAKNVEEALQILRKHPIKHISFDHDLGPGYTGYYLACEIEKLAYSGMIYPLTWKIHSRNPVGREKIKQAMENADKYWALLNPKKKDLNV